MPRPPPEIKIHECAIIRKQANALAQAIGCHLGTAVGLAGSDSEPIGGAIERMDAQCARPALDRRRDDDGVD